MYDDDMSWGEGCVVLPTFLLLFGGAAYFGGIVGVLMLCFILGLIGEITGNGSDIW